MKCKYDKNGCLDCKIASTRREIERLKKDLSFTRRDLERVLEENARLTDQLQEAQDSLIPAQCGMLALANTAAELRAENDRLKAIIARIPHDQFTADGVPCFGGETVWSDVGGTYEVDATVQAWNQGGSRCKPVTQCYSTPEAARAAKETM